MSDPLFEMLPPDTIKPSSPVHMGWRIIVADRGWVFVGDVTSHGSHLTVTSASVIRQWGTERGLGQIAPGPTAKTVVDPLGTVEIPSRAVIFTLHADASGWSCAS